MGRFKDMTIRDAERPGGAALQEGPDDSNSTTKHTAALAGCTVLRSGIADEITRAHESANESARKALLWAQRVGDLLREVQRSLPHGQWQQWVEVNLPFGVRQAQRYLRVSENWAQIKDATRESHLSFRQALEVLADHKDDDPPRIRQGSNKDSFDDPPIGDQEVDEATEAAPAADAGPVTLEAEFARVDERDDQRNVQRNDARDEQRDVERNVADTQAPRPAGDAELARQIKSEIAHVVAYARRKLEHARNAGEALLKAKAALSDADWLPWLAANVECGEAQALRYMSVAEDWEQAQAKIEDSPLRAMADVWPPPALDPAYRYEAVEPGTKTLVIVEPSSVDGHWYLTKIDSVEGVAEGSPRPVAADFVGVMLAAMGVTSSEWRQSLAQERIERNRWLGGGD